MTIRKLNIFIIILFIFSFFSAKSQDFDENGKPIINFSTPYNTVFVHLQYLNSDFYNPKIAGQTLNIKASPDSAAKLAIKLKKILDGSGLIVNMSKVPREPNYLDSSIGLNRFILFKNLPDVYLEKIEDNWYYSAHTVKIVPKLYKDMYPYSLGEFISELPEIFSSKFFFIEFWKWLGLIILLILSVLLYLIFNKIIVYFLLKLWKKVLRKNVVPTYLHSLSKPLGFLIIFLAFEKTLPLLELPIGVSYYLNLLIKILIPVIITFLIYRITNYVSEFFEKFAEKTPSKIDDKIVPIIRKFLKVVVVIFGGIYIIQNIGIDITPLLAGVSIGSLAIALAAQETIKNLFGSVTLYTDKVFEPGDWIIAEDVDGTVEEVGIRSTKVRTFSDSIIIVPNGRLADMKINNMGKRNYRRFRAMLGVIYGTPIEKINEFVVGLKKIVAEHPNTRKDYDRIYLYNLADYSIQILFDTFLITVNYDEELLVREQLITRIMVLAKSIGVDFAFPSQTIYLENGSKIDPIRISKELK